MKSNIPHATATSHEAEPTTNKQSSDELARSIAEQFDDTDNLSIYQILCRKYPKAVIAKARKGAQAVPTEKVKRSRLALFTFLIKKYAGTTD